MFLSFTVCIYVLYIFNRVNVFLGYTHIYINCNNRPVSQFLYQSYTISCFWSFGTKNWFTYCPLRTYTLIQFRFTHLFHCLNTLWQRWWQWKSVIYTFRGMTNSFEILSETPPSQTNHLNVCGQCFLWFSCGFFDTCVFHVLIFLIFLKSSIHWCLWQSLPSVWIPSGAWRLRVRLQSTGMEVSHCRMPLLFSSFFPSVLTTASHTAFSWLRSCWPATSNCINVLIVSESICQKWVRRVRVKSRRGIIGKVSRGLCPAAWAGTWCPDTA